MRKMRLKSVLVIACMTLCLVCKCERVKPAGSKSASWRKKVLDTLQHGHGVNVCPVEEAGFSPSPIRYPVPWTGGDLCGTKTYLRNDCCPGYAKMAGLPGCALVKPLSSLGETAESKNGTAFARELGKIQGLVSKNALTVFVPIDQAMASLRGPQSRLLEETWRGGDTRGPALVLYHVTPGRVFHSHLGDDAFLPTLLGAKTIRIDRFPNGLVTVNCIPLLHWDLEAKGGVVHVLQEALDPSTTDVSLMDVVLRDSRLQTFATLLVQAQLTHRLRDPGTLTVFAPTEEAFARLPTNFLENILYDPSAVQALMENHLTHGARCTSTLTDKNAVATLEGRDPLTASCNASHRFVGPDQALIVQGNVPASNGFLHVIDRVLIPRKAKSLWEIAAELKLNTFLSLLKPAGLDVVLRELGKTTIFAPTDAAFAEVGNETLTGEPTKLRALLLGHMVHGSHASQGMSDGQALQSRRLGRLRVKTGRKLKSVEDALVLVSDMEGLNGVIHVVDKVIIPPKVTIGEYLRNHPNLTQFLEALNATEDLMRKLDSDPGPFTVLAMENLDPVESAREYYTFQRVSKATDLLHLVRNHVVEDLILLRGLDDEVYYEFRNLNGEPIFVRKEGGSVSAGIGSVSPRGRDVLCANGVVQHVDRLLQRPY